MQTIFNAHQPLKQYLYELAMDKINGFIPFILKFFLSLLSLIYGLIVRLLIKHGLKHQVDLGIKVISIGNITVGGTGKTQAVSLVADFLKQQGKSCCILTRGYKRRAAGDGIGADYATLGDEGFMLKNKLGITVIAGRDRQKSAVYARKKAKFDVFILDDAFQQWRIKKDLEILMINSNNPFGNGFMLPRGILREPLDSLKRAQMIILTKTDSSDIVLQIKKKITDINNRCLILESTQQVSRVYKLWNKESLSDNETALLKNSAITLACAIGDPESFRKTASQLGLKVELFLVFTDHHHFSKKDLELIARESKKRDISNVAITEKDASRIGDEALTGLGINILVICVDLEIKKDEEQFYGRLCRVFDS
jgi:tetraacyldisaccharide 4'-kinase